MRLVQDEKYSIIYGKFRGNEDEELFRCPRELDQKDLVRFVHENRAILGFEEDDTEHLRKVPNKTLIGYFRMYYTGGWTGKWFLENGTPSAEDIAGVKAICDWINEVFPRGIGYFAKDYLSEHFKNWGNENRYLIKPKYSQDYKVCIDTTYGNDDYPIRIYVYKDTE